MKHWQSLVSIKSLERTNIHLVLLRIALMAFPFVQIRYVNVARSARTNVPAEIQYLRCGKTSTMMTMCMHTELSVLSVHHAFIVQILYRIWRCCTICMCVSAASCNYDFGMHLQYGNRDVNKLHILRFAHLLPSAGRDCWLGAVYQRCFAWRSRNITKHNVASGRTQPHFIMIGFIRPLMSVAAQHD